MTLESILKNICYKKNKMYSFPYNYHKNYYKYLKRTFIAYLKDLKKVDYKERKHLSEELYNKYSSQCCTYTPNLLKDARMVAKAVLKATKQCLKNDYNAAENTLSDLFLKNYEYILRFYVQCLELPKEFDYYRIRTDANLVTKPGDLYHIPFNMRKCINEQRFNPEGKPVLYFSRSLKEALSAIHAESGQDFAYMKYKFDPQECRNVMNRDKLFFAVIAAIPPGMDVGDVKITAPSFLTLLPLFIACSINVRNRNLQHKPEYMVPHLLYNIFIKLNFIDGIIYTPAQHKITEENMCLNYALFVDQPYDNGYNQEYARCFNTTRPLLYTSQDRMKLTNPEDVNEVEDYLIQRDKNEPTNNLLLNIPFRKV